MKNIPTQIKNSVQKTALEINAKVERNAKAPRKQRGLALADLALWVVIAAVIIAGAMGLYRYIKGSVSAGDLGEKVTLLVSDIQKNWQTAGSYTTVSGVEINKLSLIRAPLRFNTPNIEDAYGNTMLVNGSSSGFALTVGGATQPMAQDDCATIVQRLEPLASNIRIGTAATAAAGVISAGNVYKAGAVITQTGLTTGCSETSPVIAAQFR